LKFLNLKQEKFVILFYPENIIHNIHTKFQVIWLP